MKKPATTDHVKLPYTNLGVILFNFMLFNLNVVLAVVLLPNLTRFDNLIMTYSTRNEMLKAAFAAKNMFVACGTSMQINR